MSYPKAPGVPQERENKDEELADLDDIDALAPPPNRNPFREGSEPTTGPKSIQEIGRIIATSGQGLWQEIEIKEDGEGPDGTKLRAGMICYYNTQEQRVQRHKPDDFDSMGDEEIEKDLTELRANFGSAAERRAKYTELTEDEVVEPREESEESRRAGYEEIPEKRRKSKRRERPEVPKKPREISLFERLRVFWASKDNNSQVILILLALGLLLGSGTAIGTLLLFPAALPLVAGFLGLAASNLLFPLLFAGVIGSLLGMELAAVVELLRISDTSNEARETYLRRMLITTALLAGIGLGVFLAAASPALLAVFASLGGPGILAFVLAGAAGLVVSSLIASFFYAVIETRSWGFSLAVNDHPLLFRALLGALIAAGVGALMVLAFPGALAAFAVALGLTVGSPLALVTGVGTVMLLSAVFGIEFMGFLEMILNRIALTPRNAALYILIPAAIAGAAIGIFLGATVLPVLTFGLSGPAAFAVAGAIGLAASIVLAAVALGGIPSYQPRPSKIFPVPSLLSKIGILISYSNDGRWVEYGLTKDFNDGHIQVAAGNSVYFEISTGKYTTEIPSGYQDNHTPGNPSDIRIFHAMLKQMAERNEHRINTEIKEVVSGSSPGLVQRRRSEPILSGASSTEAQSRSEPRARSSSSGDISSALNADLSPEQKAKKEPESHHTHSASPHSQPGDVKAKASIAEWEVQKSSNNEKWERHICTKGGKESDRTYTTGQVEFYNKEKREFTAETPPGVNFPETPAMDASSTL